MGPVFPGAYRFVFQADPPDPSKLPPTDIVGVTVILLTCAYRGAEFLRVGYYVNTEYYDAELRETPPPHRRRDPAGALHSGGQAEGDAVPGVV